MSYNPYLMGGFNKNTNEMPTNTNMLPSGQQNTSSAQNFMNSLPNNPLMNFPMGSHGMPPTSYEPADNFSYNSMGQDHLKKLKEKFTELKDEILRMEKNPDLFKNHQLPLARVKKIMKSDEDVRMISAEAPVLFAKACEIFIVELTHRAWYYTEESKRRTLQKIDIANCITHTDIFDFLLDIIPKEDIKPAPPQRKQNETLNNPFQQFSSGQNNNNMMNNNNKNPNSNFNPLMNQNFLNMTSLMNQNNNMQQNPNQQNQGQMQNMSPYSGLNFMNPNMPFGNIKEENKNINPNSNQKGGNNNMPNK